MIDAVLGRERTVEQVRAAFFSSGALGSKYVIATQKAHPDTGLRLHPPCTVPENDDATPATGSSFLGD
jgi:hypothetical protein